MFYFPGYICWEFLNTLNFVWTISIMCLLDFNLSYSLISPIFSPSSTRIRHTTKTSSISEYCNISTTCSVTCTQYFELNSKMFHSTSQPGLNWKLVKLSQKLNKFLTAQKTGHNTCAQKKKIFQNELS